MKVGDKLYCYFDGVGGDDDITNIYLTIGKVYVVSEIHDTNDFNGLMLLTINDVGGDDWYNINDECHVWYYGKFFYNDRQYRKVKLKILNEI